MDHENESRMRILGLTLCLVAGLAAGAFLSVLAHSSKSVRGDGWQRCGVALEKFLATSLSAGPVRAEDLEKAGVSYLDAGCPYGPLMVAIAMSKEGRAGR